MLPCVVAAGVLFQINVASLAQLNIQLPSPGGHVNDFAGVIDAQTKSRLESLLQNLKERSKVDFYVATVDTTGGQDIFDFSQQLAREWNIGAKTSRGKSLLLVVSVASKSCFTQFSRLVQPDLPEGVLGEINQRMRTPLGAGQFAEAVYGGVQVFVSALGQKGGFTVQDLDNSVATPAAGDNSQTVVDVPTQPAVAIQQVRKTRPRVVSEEPKPIKAEGPAAALTESSEPKAEPSRPKTDADEPKIEVLPAKADDAPAKGTGPPPKTHVSPTKIGRASSKGPPEPVDDEAEVEEVELTLTLPLAKRADKLKNFLETHPNSKARTRATELLISTHAGLGDQLLKNGDHAGGVEQLLLAIEESDVSISDQLFSGVISQIPTNLYLRGERAAAYKAAQNIEAKFGDNPRRLLTVAGFYLGIERGDEASRVAEQAVKLAPDMAEAHRVLAFGLHITLRLDEAAVEYKRALELDPNSKGARGSLADLYRAGDKAEEALKLYDEQLKVDPKDRAARAGMVLSLFESGRKDEANAALDAALVEDPRNLPLLTGAAYWFAAHDNFEKGFELARKATAIEPRYTWAQIALVRSLLGLKRPLDAERSIRFARQYGTFPTLNYELATVLATMGLFDEAAEVLRESFVIKETNIETQLAGRLPSREPGFLELLAPERRASIYQLKAADTTENAKILKNLLAFNSALSPVEGEKLNEKRAVDTAQEFASGNDSMRGFRQVYGASQLVRNRVGLQMALELLEEAKKTADVALGVPVVTMAVQADEFRDLRARAIASGNIPDVADAPHSVLSNILRGRIEELIGWALFNQDKYAEAVDHLKRASGILPADTPSWRNALWHLGAALEQSGSNADALSYYIKSYNAGQPDAVRRSIIEQLYRKINGSLSGLDEQIGASGLSSTPTNSIPSENSTRPSSDQNAPSTVPEKAPTPEALPKETPKLELEATARAVPTPEASPTPSPETTSTPTSAPSESPARTDLPTEDEALRASASRVRTNLKITGRVLDADKNGLANVVLVLISPSGSVIASTTDTQGNYSFTVMPSQKTYRIIPSKDGYTFAPIDRAFTGLVDDQKEIEFVGSRTP